VADFVPPMATSKRSKNSAKLPTHRTLRLIGPKPVEEEEESSNTESHYLKPKMVKGMLVMMKMKI
jgi:hypothetical protein